MGKALFCGNCIFAKQKEQKNYLKQNSTKDNEK